MKTMKFTKSIIAIALGIIMIPALTMAAGRPEISIMGVTHLDSDSASISVAYDATNASYADDRLDLPSVYVKYTNRETGTSRVTYDQMQLIGTANTVYFHLRDLEPDTEYSYYAALRYGGRIYKTSSERFTTTDGTFRYQNPGTQPIPQPIPEPRVVQPTGSLWTWLGFGTVSANNPIERAKDNVVEKVVTGGSGRANGVALSITDEQARVTRGDRIEFTIKYQNTTTVSLKNAEIVVALPEQYEFISSTADMDYDERDNTVTIPLGRVAPETIKQVTFKARAIGDGNGEIKTIATLYHEAGKVSATDRDAYNGGSSSVLGASVFGAGFFPQTLAGWMIIIFLIAILIIVARRYANKPEPEVVDPNLNKKTA